LQDVLILRLALPAAELQVLDRPHEHRDAGHVAHLAAQAPITCFICARSLRFFSVTNMRPVFCEPVPPLNELTLFTLGRRE